MGELGPFILFCSVVFVIAVFSQWAFICEIAKQLKDQKGFLEINLILLAVIACILIFSFSDKPPSDETIRNIILALGGIGGFYALIIAKKRQDRFEEQVRQNHVTLKAQQRQNFNDQLGRAVEMLANQDQTSIRMAGVRILQELGKSSNIKRKQLVKEILVDYIHEKASLDNPQRHPHRKEIEIAITAISSIKSNIYTKFTKLDFNYCSFEDIEFQNFGFVRCEMKKVIFTCVNFINCQFEFIDCTESRLNEIYFKNTNLFIIDLTKADLIGVYGLDQKIFDGVIYEKGRPPSFIIDSLSLKINKDQQFIWSEYEGRLCRFEGKNYGTVRLNWNTKPLPQPPNQR